MASNYHENYKITNGHFVIINNMYFKPPPQMNLNVHETREGALEDMKRVKQLAKNLGYTFEIHRNMKAKQIEVLLDEWSEKDYSSIDAILIFIMSHGNKGTIISADCQDIFLAEFIMSFKSNPTLKDKPKIFFIQACRGDTVLGLDGDNSEELQIPMGADILLAFSSIENYMSVRDSEDGSWYIQTLIDVIENSKNKDINTILTKVNGKIWEKVGKYKGKPIKMMPTFNHCLTKLFYFTEPDDINEVNRNVKLF